MGTRPIFRPPPPPGIYDPTHPDGGLYPEDGAVSDPFGGKTVGQVVDDIKDLVKTDTQEKATPKAKPKTKAREVDCSEVQDEAACNQCTLKQGFIAKPLTGRYVTLKNLVNYEYQLMVANLNAAPLVFTFAVAAKADPERKFFSVDTIYDYMERGGFSRTVMEWHFNACEFDGFWPSMCTVVEAKGNYQHFLDENGDPKYGFVAGSVFEPWGFQMRRQKAAIKITEPQGKLEWYFMQRIVLEAGADLGGIDRSICKHLPMPGQVP